jgi:hypothetical protein
MTGPRSDPVTFGPPPHPSRCSCGDCAAVPFTYTSQAVAGPDGMIVYTVHTTVNDGRGNRTISTTAAARVPLTPRLTWPVPGIARLSLVASDGVEAGFTSVSLAPGPAPQEVMVPSGVWTEIPDALLEVFHETGADVKVIVHDGYEVSGLHNLRGLRVRGAPDRDYDDTYD